MGFDIGIDLANGFFQEKAEQIDQGFRNTCRYPISKSWEDRKSMTQTTID